MSKSRGSKQTSSHLRSTTPEGLTTSRLFSFVDTNEEASAESAILREAIGSDLESWSLEPFVASTFSLLRTILVIVSLVVMFLAQICSSSAVCCLCHRCCVELILWLILL